LSVIVSGGPAGEQSPGAGASDATTGGTFVSDATATDGGADDGDTAPRCEASPFVGVADAVECREPIALVLALGMGEVQPMSANPSTRTAARIRLAFTLR
jgi:hypothetical protein